MVPSCAKHRILDEIKSIFHNFLSTIIWWTKEKQRTQALKITCKNGCYSTCNFLFEDGLSPSKNSLFYLLQRKPFKNKEKYFCTSSWKLFSYLSSLNFCLDFFSHVGKLLDKKTKVNFKTYESQPGKQTITIHILPNI